MILFTVEISDFSKLKSIPAIYSNRVLKYFLVFQYFQRSEIFSSVLKKFLFKKMCFF